MPNNRNFNADAQSATDRALDKFTDLMIEKIETLQGDWKKPWFTPGVLQAPRNMSGRYYNGLNSLMLMLQAEKMGYDMNAWATFDRITNLNYVKDNAGNRLLARDNYGNKLPQVCINKGEKSFPVFLTTFTVVDKETKKHIKYDDYKELTKEEQEKYNVFPKLQTFNVFNVAAQTNIKDTRPELFEKLKEQFAPQQIKHEGEMTSHPAIDKMIDSNLFFCPIKQVKGDNAYYSVSQDEIVIPTREQFVDGEAFATNALHECAHATGSADRLGRIKGGQPFGSPEYAKEELTAELSAAVVASQYGLTKHVKSDSAAYLKSWLGSLHESPDFLKTVLTDVRKCSSMLNQRIEAIQLELDKGEKADWSQFRSGALPQQPLAQPDLAPAPAKEQPAEKTVEEPAVHFHRGR